MVKETKVKVKPLSQEEGQRAEQGELLQELCRQKGWVDVLHPYLDRILTRSWVNPRECKNLKEFGWQEIQRADYAQFVKELFGWIEASIEDAQFLRKKQKGEIKEEFRI